MMKQYSRALILSLVLLMAASLAWSAQQQSPPTPTPAQGFKETINPADLPQAVRQAIANTAPEDSPVSATKINRDGRIGYLVVITGVRGKREILVTDDGKVVKNEVKPEGQSETPAQGFKDTINPAELPQSVRQALAHTAPEDSPVTAHKVMRDGKVAYVIMTTGVRGKREILITEDGKVVKNERKPEHQPETPAQGFKETINPADLPQTVRQALANTAPEDSPVTAHKIMRDGQVGYVIMTTGVRGKREILITEDGKVVKNERKPEDNSLNSRGERKLDKAQDRGEQKIQKTKDRGDKKDEKKDNQGK